MDTHPNSSASAPLVCVAQGNSLNFGRIEPSHIHIPRPSRLRQAATPQPVMTEPQMDEAA